MYPLFVRNFLIIDGKITEILILVHKLMYYSSLTMSNLKFNLHLLHPVVCPVMKVHLVAVNTTVDYKPILKYLIFGLYYFYLHDIFRSTKIIIKWFLLIHLL
jgi:hypothetical protein